MLFCFYFYYLLARLATLWNKKKMEKGIDINQTTKDGENALHYASFKGQKEKIELLIEKGIDINQTNNNGENDYIMHLKEVTKKQYNS